MKYIQMLMIFIMSTSASFAAPALSIKREHVQPDGSAFIGTLKGDEHFSWIDLGAGLTAVYNYDSKYFEYGAIDPNGSHSGRSVAASLER